ncbi:hypothetical protein [Streptomyces sp. NPDC058603]|uniref:hypothetical protein n=1 Tax=Streptomyces sp. NPDC058603 TaxID=3346551 RepID=UPI00365C4C11
MTRTEADTKRRRFLADAASGFPERTRVVLYACLPDSRAPATVMPGLRAHAEARDWVVAAEHHDLSPLTTPRTERRNWREVELLMRSGNVQGLVAPSEAHIAHSPELRTQLREWLAEYRVFAAYIGKRDSGGAPAKADGVAE